MMTSIFHLGSCDTCKRILKELQPLNGVTLIDIKENPLTPAQVDEMKALSGSYESLFSRRARLYKEKGLKDQKLGEEDFKSLILEHYTFLKRPVIISGKEIFVGNSAKVVAAAKKSLHP